MGIAKPGNGLAPVLSVAVSAALLAGDLLAIHDQTRTKRATDDFRIQNLEPVRDRHSTHCICLCAFFVVERASPAAVAFAVVGAFLGPQPSCRRGAALAAHFSRTSSSAPH